MSRKAMEAKKPVERVAPDSIRLDKFLKISRIIKRRSVANDACSTGHVTVNGREAKPGTEAGQLHDCFMSRLACEPWAMKNKTGGKENGRDDEGRRGARERGYPV